jgi:enoyl-CoA hydratase/carnithine racemase
MSQMSIRGAKRAIDAIAAGMSKEAPAYRALTETAARGRDFAEGRAAFAGKRTAKFAFRGLTAPLKPA